MSVAPLEPFAELCALCKDLSDLSAVSGLLGWDEQVMMPPGATAARARQKAVMAAVMHEKATSKQLASSIAAAKQSSAQLGPFESATVRDAEREYNLAIGVPKELKRKIAAKEVESVQSWVAARKNSDYHSFEPHLREMLGLAKEKAVAMRPSMKPYDTMIDVYERGMTADRLTEIFDSVAAPLKLVLEKVLHMKEASTKKVHPALLGGDEWDVQKQVQFCKDVCQLLGFEMEKGRIGELYAVLHPSRSMLLNI